MARPEKCRMICSEPKVRRFSPSGALSSGEVTLQFDEYEVLRLIDLEGLTQAQCAEKLGVSRPTVTRIYDNARRTLSQSVVEGKALKIEGGDVIVCAAYRDECEHVENCCHKKPQPSTPDREIPSAEDIARVKGLGFLRDKNTEDCFNARVITRNGKITAKEHTAIAEAAERFGSGEVAMTSRLTLEIQGIPYRNIEPLRAWLAQYGLETGGTGPKVRPVVSCKGTTCQYGLIDTFDLSSEIHNRFYKSYHELKLPHKFKIAVGGCPNNCVKPDLNDLGIIGQRVPQVDIEKCRSCKVCQIEKSCPMHAAALVDGKIVIDETVCNHCGRCIGKCPFKAFESSVSGYRVYIGGRWGKKVARGIPLAPVFTSREEVLEIVEKAILLFRAQGIAGERFADTIDRIGFDAMQEQLLTRSTESLREEALPAATEGSTSC